MCWDGFKGRKWRDDVDVRDFIQNNYTIYDGDESFLAGPTDATNKLWAELSKLQKEERAKGGVLDMETEVVSTITAYGPGYINENMKDLEKVLQVHMDMRLMRSSIRFLQSITGHIIRLYLRRIHLKCMPPDITE